MQDKYLNQSIIIHRPDFEVPYNELTTLFPKSQNSKLECKNSRDIPFTIGETQTHHDVLLTVYARISFFQINFGLGLVVVGGGGGGGGGVALNL